MNKANDERAAHSRAAFAQESYTICDQGTDEKLRNQNLAGSRRVKLDKDAEEYKTLLVTCRVCVKKF